MLTAVLGCEGFVTSVVLSWLHMCVIVHLWRWLCAFCRVNFHGCRLQFYWFCNNMPIMTCFAVDLESVGSYNGTEVGSIAKQLYTG